EIFTTRQPFVIGPITDEYGEFISSLAPVIDPVSDKVLMVVGIDILSNSWKQELRKARIFPISITFFLFCLYLIGVFFYQSGFKRETLFRIPVSFIEGGLILFAGLLITFILAWIVYQNEMDERSFVFNQQGELRDSRIQSALEGFFTDFNILARFVENSEEITREEFDSFTKYLEDNQGIQCYALASFTGGDQAVIHFQHPEIPDWWFPEPGLLDTSISRVIQQSFNEMLPQAMRIDPRRNDSGQPQNLLLVYPLIRPYLPRLPHRTAGLRKDVILVQISLQYLLGGHGRGTGEGSSLIRTGLWELHQGSEPLFILGTDSLAGLCEVSAFSSGLVALKPFTTVSPLFIFGRTLAVISCPQETFFSEYPIYTSWLTILAGILMAGAIAFFIGLLRNRQIALEKAVGQRTWELQEKVTELAAARDKAEAGDRLKTAFIRNISHEVRTPLNGILGFSDLITASDLTAEERKKYSERIQSNSARLLTTITDYMDISRIESGTIEMHPSVFMAGEIIQTLFASFEKKFQQHGLSLQLAVPETKSSATICTDRDLLVKILTNLLENSFKFTRQGTVTLGYSQTNQIIRFFVTDTGIGMTQEALLKSVEPFFQEEVSDTRGHEGSGLGLSIASGLIRLLGGTMELTSTKGTGTNVSFSLPEYSQGKPASGNTRMNLPALLDNAALLIVEDDLTNLQYIETLLNRTGLKILTASDGKQAVDFCQNHPEIALVLMDIKMPVMDGLEATRLIKHQRKSLPIIALTAYAFTGDAEMGLEAGCDDYLCKPFTKVELMNKIRPFLPFDKSSMV
ncbi:MAG: response regulator, partial [Bacteroidales bacterium]|nr:response regulator [Bacteroidales bacterium]